MTHLPLYIERFKLQNLGWFDIQEALHLTSGDRLTKSHNPVIMGLYNFAVCQNRPKNTVWPWEHKFTVDIGKAGGDGECIRVDFKNGAHKAPFYKSALYNRIDWHRTLYTPIHSKKKVNESTTEIRNLLLKDDNYLWVCILHYETPGIDITKPHLLPDVTLELLTCENEAQLAYKQIWGRPPIGNPGAKGKLKSEKRPHNTPMSLSERHFDQARLPG